MNAIYPRYDSEFACASRVLVVDSEEAHTRLMRLALEREGFDVEIVGSVDEAMSKPLGDYGLFIVDMKMNNMQGVDFARMLRRSPSTVNTPLIICSTMENDHDIVDGLDAGADDYISRSISVPMLLARVNSLMRRHYRCKRS